MEANEDEERLLRSVALQNANRILQARQRAEEELIRAKEALELRTEELAHSLAMMRATLESTTDGILVTDGGGKVTGFNENFVEMWRVPREVMDSGDHRRLLEETSRQFKDPQQFLARIDEISRASPPQSQDLLELADGRVFERSTRIQFVDERIVGRVWSFRDITDRRRAEEALQKQSEWLRVALSSIGDAVIATDGRGRVTFLNRVAESLTGWTQAEAIGQPLPEVFRIVNDQGRQPVENPALRTLREGAIVGLTNHTILIAKDGSERPIDDSAAPMRDESGTMVGAVLVFRDVTERRRVENNLWKQSERLRLLWEAAAVLLTTEEPDVMLQELFAKIAPHLGLDAYFNYMVTETGDALRLESCAGISEATARSIARLELGQAISGTVALRRQPLVVTHIQQTDDPVVDLVRSFGIRVYACTPLLAEGRLLGTLSFASRTRDQFDDEELEFLRTLTHYVTVAYERLRLVSELQDNDRKKDDFIALLGHELRNPLAPIRNGLQVIRLAGTDANAIAQARGMMDRQLGHMVRLIDDLLDVSRIGRQKMELRRARLLLADVVGNAVETARPVIEEAGHDLSVELPPEPIWLDADLTRLAQVLSNLLTNSAKYTERGGRIWLHADRREHEVVVSVRDTGIGIPANDLPHIFDMFSQVDRSIERSTGGLGIGLAIVKGLVEMHGGTVTVASDGQGLGSTFTVRLPVPEALDEAVPAAPAGDNRSAAGSKQRILVVDDNEDAARTMARVLKLLGNEVELAHDGIEAVEAAERFRPEVVLMDVGMPQLNGYEATRRIRERPWGQAAIIIALTGWGQEGDRVQSREAGCNGHLVKPVNLPDLERLLNELTDRANTSNSPVI